MELLIIIFSLFLLGLYLFAPAFRRRVNALFTGVFYWLAINLHIPTWAIALSRWLWQRFRSGLLFIMAMLVLLSGVWMYAYRTGNPQVLLVAMAITGVILMLVAVLSQVVQGLGGWFGLETKTGGFGKMAISIILWIMVNFAILSIPNNWYFNHLWVPAVVTALLLAFMLKGWYYNEAPKFAPETLIIIFIGFLMVSAYMNWEAGKIRLPGWLQNKANEIRLEKEVDGQMLLASFVQTSVAYQYNPQSHTYKPLPQIKYRPGSTVLVSRPDSSPDASKGESMLEVMRQNEYGDFFGTGIWVPARKLEYLSPSKLREKQKQKSISIKKDSTLTKKGRVIIFKEPWMQIPARGVVEFTLSPQLVSSTYKKDWRKSRPVFMEVNNDSHPYGLINIYAKNKNEKKTGVITIHQNYPTYEIRFYTKDAKFLLITAKKTKEGVLKVEIKTK